jgi:hypothetical protein
MHSAEADARKVNDNAVVRAGGEWSRETCKTANHPMAITVNRGGADNWTGTVATELANTMHHHAGAIEPVASLRIGAHHHHSCSQER